MIKLTDSARYESIKLRAELTAEEIKKITAGKFLEIQEE